MLNQPKINIIYTEEELNKEKRPKWTLQEI